MDVDRPIGLLPDLIVDRDSWSALAPRPWNITDELRAAWAWVTGRNIRVAVLDTGFRSHPDLPKPIATRDFTGKGNVDDGNGHGCIAPDDEVYTSNCGLQRIETFFDRMSGVAHFLPGKKVVKDISRHNVFTFSLDVDGPVPRTVRRRITHVHKLHHTGEVFEVDVNGETLTLTPWHPVYVQRSSTGKTRRVVKVRADQLRQGDAVCLLPQSKESIHSELLQLPLPDGGFVALDESLAMWIGLVLTDGHVCSRQSTVEFTSANDAHIELFDALCRRCFGKQARIYRPSNRAPSAKISGAAWHVARSMISVGAKSKTIEFPELIAKSPRPVIESFVAGCIEGDGNLLGGRLRLTTGSQAFARGLCRILSSLGVRASRAWQSGKKSNFGGDGWWVVRIGAWPEMSQRLRVKTGELRTAAKGHWTAAIKAIRRKHYDGALYDFTVEGSHNYVANGLVVSNTHCAGSAVGRNGIGAAPDAELIVGKVLSDSGSGSTRGINAGIRWAADEGAHIISLSLGGPGPASQEDRDALQYAIDKGCIIFAAAGNAGYNGANTIGYPGRYEEVICVGAYRQDGSIANFSSGGREIDIANPGEQILSASHRGGYVAMSGTSMATPNAAGRAALYLQYQQGRGLPLPRGSEAWKAIYRKFAKDAGAPGEDPRFGIGIPLDKEMLSHLAETDWI